VASHTKIMEASKVNVESDVVAHASNPKHSGRENQEDCGSRPAQEKIRKTPFHTY
jgi:hypothetical protein